MDPFLQFHQIHSDDDKSDKYKIQFSTKFNELKEGYHIEIKRLIGMMETVCEQTKTLLITQNEIRLVTVDEIDVKINSIKDKFYTLTLKLKEKVCRSILEHWKVYCDSKSIPFGDPNVLHYNWFTKRKFLYFN